MTQRRQQRAGAAQARVSGLAGDPRVARNARSAGMSDVTLGRGLTVDREGKLAVTPGPGVPDPPASASVEDLATTLRALLRSLRTGGQVQE